jgi:hypothetical protein
MIYDFLYNRGVSPEDTAFFNDTATTEIYTRKHRIIEKIKKNMESM